jgi:hypothetical protein
VDYYIYVSDAKLDMLAAQVPSRIWRRTARDLKIDLKVLGVSVHDDPRPENRYSKLRMVDKHLHDAGEVGTVAAPGRWFAGTASLAWGTVGNADEVVYFTSVVDGTLLGLTGSTHHVLGGQRTSYVDTDPERYAPGGSSARVMVESELAGGLATADIESEGRFVRGERTAIATMLGIHRRLRGHEETLTFLAKRLLERPASEVDLHAGLQMQGAELPPFDRVLLGTPLYVAMAD